MTISYITRKMLWAKSGNRCAFPECPQTLTHKTESGSESIIGEECHIVAKSMDGPRGKNWDVTEQPDAYENLILLCPTHHEIIDKNPVTHTVEQLQKMKKDHEDNIKRLGSNDENLQLDKERYAKIVNEFCALVSIDKWRNWSYCVLSEAPRMNVGIYKNLYELRMKLPEVAWPNRYPELEKSFENFRIVLADFLEIFSEYSFEHEDDIRGVPRRYNEFYFEKEKYDEELRFYKNRVSLICDLMSELTCSANLICKQVREVFPDFEGIDRVISVFYDYGIKSCQYRCEYSETECKNEPYPYPGFDTFASERQNRSYNNFNQQPCQEQ